VDAARIEAAKGLTLVVVKNLTAPLAVTRNAEKVAEAFKVIYAAIEEVTTEKAGKE